MSFDKGGYFEQGRKSWFYWHNFAWVSLASIFYFFVWSYSWESKAFVFSHPFGSNYNDSDRLDAWPANLLQSTVGLLLRGALEMSLVSCYAAFGRGTAECMDKHSHWEPAPSLIMKALHWLWKNATGLRKPNFLGIFLVLNVLERENINPYLKESVRPHTWNNKI